MLQSISNFLETTHFNRFDDFSDNNGYLQFSNCGIEGEILIITIQRNGDNAFINFEVNGKLIPNEGLEISSLKEFKEFFKTNIEPYGAYVD